MRGTIDRWVDLGLQWSMSFFSGLTRRLVGLFGRKSPQQTSLPGRATSRQHLGRAGEELACRFLQENGYKIVARNVRYPVGEIDIVAARQETLVFVEVRTRRSTRHHEIWETVTAAKQRRVIRAAQHFLRDHRVFHRRLRFDLITILWPAEAEAEPQITHYEAAFGDG